MKKQQILIIGMVAILFLVISLFLWITNRKLIKTTKEKTELDMNYQALKMQKNEIDISLDLKQKENIRLRYEKDSIITILNNLKKKNSKLIQDYNQQIELIKNIPADSSYKAIISRYLTFGNEPLDFPFAASQVKGIHEDIVENQYLRASLDNANGRILQYEDLNDTNEMLLGNLQDQNKELINKNILSEKQVQNLKDQKDIIEKQVKKEKRKKNFYKFTSVILGTATVTLLLL